ncbi:hypothetical protein CARUB_v10023281mg [Capsella rubella]|uniref:RING-type E3 ubiquitin transferase n=1 Tax=Capsella rubella TaxID=81985 RepID=R0HPG9_9BRAS|nr:uncharacterized protein LOC17887568 [Capsella rubella]EOA27180.1 hypothetical protein CARUB_v10023281mg [Capsella rubella]
MDSALLASSPDLESPPPVLISTSSSSNNVERADGAHHGVFNWREFFYSSCRNVSESNVICFLLGLYLLSFALFILIETTYAPKNVWLGPNSSILVESSSIFVNSIKVTELDYSNPGLQLYGFYGSPPLDCVVNWSESRVLPVPHHSNKGWSYYFNQGTFMNISYRVKPQGSAVHLVVDEGSRGISNSFWDAPTYHNKFWWSNLIEGSGMVELEISKSSSYYLAVANLNNMREVEVELTIDVRAALYDTKQSLYNCTFSNGECTLKLNALSPVGNSVVITSPAPGHQGVSIEDEWYIRLSYEPNVIGYVIFTGLGISFMLVAIRFCNRLQCGGEVRHLTENVSSDDSFTNDDADLEELMGSNGETSNRTRCLCAICFDTPRDCFFLPCGHCVSCYQCGTKMAEAAGSCPICRRKMKKVKRIYTV